MRDMTLKKDLYLKVVLTAIAVFLGLLVFQNLGWLPTANAVAPGQQKAGQEQLNVHLPKGMALVPVDERGYLKVRLAEDELLNVNIMRVNGRDMYGEYLPVDIRAVDGSGLFGGAVPVQTR